MIIRTMSNVEMAAEFRSEHHELIEYVRKITPKFRRLAIKATHFPVYVLPITYTSKKKNKYLLFFRIREKKIWYNPKMSVICICDRPEGKVALQYGETSDCTYLYSPHFFSRYRTRFLKDESLATIDVIKRYFKENSALSRRMDDKDEFVAASKEGMILGVHEDNIYIARTFISPDIMFPDQVDLKERWRPYLEKLRGELK